MNILAAVFCSHYNLYGGSERGEHQVIVEAHDKNSPAINIPSRRSTNKLRTPPTTDSFAVAADVNN